MVGGVIYPAVFRQLQPSIGFGWATRTIAFIMLVTSAIPILGMHERVPHISKYAPVKLQLFHGIPHLLFCFGMLFGFMGIYIFFVYVQLFALLECSMEQNLALYLLAVVNAGSVFGRLIPSYFADKIGPVNMFIPFAFSTALLTFSWIAIKDPIGLVVFCVLYGFFSGTFVSLPGPMGVSLSPNMRNIGRRLGVSVAFSGTGLLIGNPIAGLISQKERNWIGLQIWAGVMVVASGCFIVAARLMKSGPKLRAKI